MIDEFMPADGTARRLTGGAAARALEMEGAARRRPRRVEATLDPFARTGA